MLLGMFPGGQQALCGIPEYQHGDELLQYTLVAVDARKYSPMAKHSGPISARSPILQLP